MDEAENLRTALRLFREFVQNNATQWRIGASHHHPIWQMVAETLGDDNDLKPTEAEWQLVRPAS